MCDLDLLRERYLHGWCGAFAIQISRRTGWQIVGVFVETERRVPSHVACQRPDGLFVDARGIALTEVELHDGYRWKDYRISTHPLTEDHVSRVFGRNVADYELALEHIDLLLPELDAEAAPTLAM